MNLFRRQLNKDRILINWHPEEYDSFDQRQWFVFKTNENNQNTFESIPFPNYPDPSRTIRCINLAIGSDIYLLRDDLDTTNLSMRFDLRLRTGANVEDNTYSVQIIIFVSKYFLKKTTWQTKEIVNKKSSLCEKISGAVNKLFVL